MTVKLDEDLLSAIEHEYNTLKGTSVEVTVEDEPVPEAIEPEEPVTIDPPSAWPSFRMFSEVFGKVPDGKRDIPVPEFDPSHWPDEARAMIPTLPPYWEHNLGTMYAIALAVLCGDTTLLTGPTGTGKTSSLVAFAAECGIPVWMTSCYRRMEHTDFVGSSSLRADEKTGANVTAYNPTQLVNSIMLGGMAIVDEAFRSPTLMAIQSLLESGHSLVLSEADGLSEEERVLVAQKGRWWIMLTDNTCGTGDHTGSYDAEVQDLSTLDRITTTVYVDYNPASVECNILKRAVPNLKDKVIDDMVSVSGLVRDAFKNGKVMQTMSMRALLSWAEKTHVTGSLDYGFARAYFCKLDPQSAAIANEVWHQVFGRDLRA